MSSGFAIGISEIDESSSGEAGSQSAAELCNCFLFGFTITVKQARGGYADGKEV